MELTAQYTMEAFSSATLICERRPTFQPGEVSPLNCGQELASFNLPSLYE
jgi:hypothetical protein